MLWRSALGPGPRSPDAETTWRPQRPVDVGLTLAPLRRGARDPTLVRTPDGAWWRTSRYVGGPATSRLTWRGLHEVTCQAWGPGATEAVAGVPDLLGGCDVDDGFEPGHPLLAAAAARHPGLRIPRTGRVLEALVPAVLEQKVTGREARSAFRHLVLRFGEAPPGPAPFGMAVPPSAQVWRAVPSWQWHAAGVDPQRSRTIVRAAAVAERLEQAAEMSPDDAGRRLSAVPGIGGWTVAEVAQRAFGDADALSVGDYHLSAFVGWALLGRPLDDDGMVARLEPWRPHRYRVVRLLECSGVRAPRFGPRLTIQDHRRH